MKWCFIIYWVFYSALFALECLIPSMPLWMSYAVLSGYWISYIYLGGVFAFYLYIELSYKNEYAEGLIVAFISRSILQIMSIFGYQDKRFVLAVTGFCALMWVAIMANRRLRRKINAIEKNLL